MGPLTQQHIVKMLHILSLKVQAEIKELYEHMNAYDLSPPPPWYTSQPLNLNIVEEHGGFHKPQTHSYIFNGLNVSLWNTSICWKT